MCKTTNIHIKICISRHCRTEHYVPLCISKNSSDFLLLPDEDHAWIPRRSFVVRGSHHHHSSSAMTCLVQDSILKLLIAVFWVIEFLSEPCCSKIARRVAFTRSGSSCSVSKRRINAQEEDRLQRLSVHSMPLVISVVLFKIPIFPNVSCRYALWIFLRCASFIAIAASKKVNSSSADFKQC